MASPPSHVQALLPDPVSLKLKLVQEQDEGRVLIVVAAAGSSARCLECARPSHSVHSRYCRVLKDLPWQGSTVRIRLEVRRFRCGYRDCSRVTFAESLPLVAQRYGRQTSRFAETLRLIGYVLGGEAGARLSRRLGMHTSPDTVLRRLKNGPAVPVKGIRVVGVDDWAWRKGQSYGTILVDLEQHTPIDLLPERSAESLAAWLRLHPGTEIISRDRASLYAEGAARGAPQAIQVADRFHLLCNLTSAVERVLEQKRTALAKSEVVLPAPEPLQADRAAAIPTRTEEMKERRRQKRLARYNEVITLSRDGMSQQGISRTLHIGRKTVRRFLRAGQFPERAIARRKPARVNAFKDFLNRRWAEGCHNATQLWHEIQAEGYAGGRSMVACFVAALRTHENKCFRRTVHARPHKAKPPSPRQAAMLLARPPEKLKSDEQQLLAQLTAACPEVSTLHALTQGFANVFRSKKSDALQNWLAEATASGLPEINRFCDGLLRDASAVTAAVILPWSNGQVEGQIHRLKLVKRQMYGRAQFKLLRCRVLPYVFGAATPSHQRSP